MPIAPRQVGDELISTGDARRLHAALRGGCDFATWITGRIAECGFVEGRYYAAIDPPERGNQTGRAQKTVEGLSSPVSGSAKARAQKTTENFIGLDMAKELGMVGGELRHLDLDLAPRQGFAALRMIRKLIKRWMPELDKLDPQSTIIEKCTLAERHEFRDNSKVISGGGGMRRNTVVFALIIAGFMTLTAPAHSQERTLRMPNGGSVFVWRSKDAMREGLSLIGAGVHETNPQLVIRLISCIVPSGTRAIITDGGFATQDVLVTSGPDAGCRGNLQTEFVR